MMTQDRGAKGTATEKLAKAIVKEQTAQKRKDKAKKALDDFIGNLLKVVILFPVLVWLVGAFLGVW